MHMGQAVTFSIKEPNTGKCKRGRLGHLKVLKDLFLKQTYIEKWQMWSDFESDPAANN